MARLQQLKDSRALAVTVAVLAAIAFRLPELLNPGVVNSDSAVVGLQAMHILRGEWHWFLWGSGYQTTADSVVAAALFVIMGATPLALMVTAVLGHLLAIVFALLTLIRRLSAWLALLLVLPLALASAPTHTYTLHPPRQTALTIVFAAIFLLDGAARARRTRLHFAVGSALGSFACFADPYALVFLPGVTLLALLSIFDVVAPRKVQVKLAVASALGLAVGAIPFALVRLLPQSSGGPLMLTRDVLAHNWDLFKGPCLPWLLGTRVLHQPVGAADYLVWHPPVAFQVVQWLGAMGFFVALVMVVVLARSARVPWELRRLSWMALLTVTVTCAGFLLSVMPMDHYSSRYLVAMVLVVPFSAAPLATRAKRTLIFGILLPMVVSFATCGWLGYEPCVKGLRIVDAHWSQSETRLQQELTRRGVKYAEADYWAAYRLTFMFQEAVTVVPIHPKQDRYPPYRQAFDRAPTYAYIFDRHRSEESQKTVAKHVGKGLLERFSVGDFEVYLVDRALRQTTASDG
jgi:hypothetical protein